MTTPNHARPSPLASQRCSHHRCRVSTPLQYTEGTNYILGVAPQAWVSVFKRASAASVRGLAPGTLLGAVLAAVAALHALR